MINIIGLAVSILTFLILAITMYWGSSHNVTVNNKTYVMVNETVITHENVTIPNREPAPVTLDTTNIQSNWDVPGNFDSSFGNDLVIQSFDPAFLSSAKVSKMLK
jgi:hypothetical protein